MKKLSCNFAQTHATFFVVTVAKITNSPVLKQISLVYKVKLINRHIVITAKIGKIILIFLSYIIFLCLVWISQQIQ